MASFFRRASKSKIGTAIMVVVLLAIIAGFAVADLQNIGTGTTGFGTGTSTLATVGGEKITEREMSEAMQRRLQEVRQERPEADYAAIAGDFDAILEALVDQRTLIAFADKYRFPLSKRLLDAEIAQIPQTKGLNGQFSEQSYQAFLAQQRLTDAEVRQVLSGGLLQRLLLTPVATNGHAAVGMATPYASMLLEAREGEVAVIPSELFRAGLKPTDADLQRFYAANRARYTVPEQRVVRIARLGPAQVASVTATDKEIADYYNANRATYAPSDTRTLSQVVVQEQAVANGIAQRAKGGAALAAAAAPAGGSAAVTTLRDQSRQAYAGVAGERAAAAVFGAASGTIVGPVQSDFGWVVVKVDSVKSLGGRSLDQARGEISARLTVEKRKRAVEDLVDRMQTVIDDGGNFAEAVAAAKLAVTTTPLVMANGASRANPSFKLPAELAPALKAAFEIASNDPPEIVSLPGDQGYALISPGEVVPAAAAPLASIREQVAGQWVEDQAGKRAQGAATRIAARASSGASLADAMRAAGVSLPPARPVAARRLQIATAQGEVSPALKMLFSVGAGKSQMGRDPQGRGFFVVKVNKITPGNAMLQPGLIAQMQGELRSAVSQDYVQQFLAAMRREMGAKRNDSAIQAFRTRLLSGS